jgi:hypothetical protein
MTPLETLSRNRVMSRMMSRREPLQEERNSPNTPPPSASPITAPVVAVSPGSPPPNRPKLLFPDALDFGYATLMGGATPASVRALWQSKEWSPTNCADVFQRLSDQREIDGVSFWSKLGIVDVLSVSPTEWLKISPIVFVVGVQERLTGTWPSLQSAIGLLEVIANTEITPPAFISGLAQQYNTSDTELDTLCASYQETKKSWRKSKSVTVDFDRAQAFQSILILKLSHYIGRLDWGATPFEMLYKSMSEMHKQG